MVNGCSSGRSFCLAGREHWASLTMKDIGNPKKSHKANFGPCRIAIGLKRKPDCHRDKSQANFSSGQNQGFLPN